MDSYIFINYFLLFGGIFVLWCSVKNYDWFFNNYILAVSLFDRLLGRRITQVIYIVFSLLLIIAAIPKIFNPAPAIDTGFVQELARPFNISLVDAKHAEGELKMLPDKVKNLVTDDKGWVSFWININPSDQYYRDMLNSTAEDSRFNSNIGIYINKKTNNAISLNGAMVYLDKDLHVCGHWLYSQYPLESAKFIFVLSKNNDQLTVYYFRAGTAIFNEVVS